MKQKHLYKISDGNYSLCLLNNYMEFLGCGEMHQIMFTDITNNIFYCLNFSDITM